MTCEEPQVALPFTVAVGLKPPWKKPQVTPLALSRSPTFLPVMVISPAFGLETADSLHIEELKKEYNTLGHARKTAPQKRRLNQVKEELADAPEWQLNTPQAKKRTALLAEIHRELKARR